MIDALPDVVLSHDNTAPIRQTWLEFGQKYVVIPEKMAITMDHAVSTVLPTPSSSLPLELLSPSLRPPQSLPGPARVRREESTPPQQQTTKTLHRTQEPAPKSPAKPTEKPTGKKSAP